MNEAIKNGFVDELEKLGFSQLAKKLTAFKPKITPPKPTAMKLPKMPKAPTTPSSQLSGLSSQGSIQRGVAR